MRTYKRKTTRGTTSVDVYELAALEVMEKNRKYRDVAQEFDICYVSQFTIVQFCEKKKAGAPLKIGYKKTRLVLMAEQEPFIAEYLLKCASIFFGLLPSEMKKLAYQCAMFYKVEIPSSWKANEMAGNDFQFTNFMRRNPTLAIRTPEGNSLSRATSFNRTNVQLFFEKYRSDRPATTVQNQSFVSKPPVDDEMNADNNLSLNLENSEALNDIPNLDISITEVISQMSNEPVVGPSGVQKDTRDFMVETIRPLPKAASRASNLKKSAILTDTPEKNALEEEHNIRELKKKKMSAKDQNVKNKGEGIGKGKGKSKGNGNLKKGEKVEKVK